MSDDRVRHGGVVDWTRLGCGVVLVVGVPAWAAFTALAVHGWLFDWKSKNGFDQSPQPSEIVGAWVAGGFRSAVLFLALFAVTAALLGGITVVGRWVRRRGEARLIARYERGVGDVDTVDADAWVGAADAMEPDEDEDEEPDDAPTDPGVGR